MLTRRPARALLGPDVVPFTPPRPLSRRTIRQTIGDRQADVELEFHPAVVAPRLASAGWRTFPVPGGLIAAYKSYDGPAPLGSEVTR